MTLPNNPCTNVGQGNLNTTRGEYEYEALYEILPSHGHSNATNATNATRICEAEPKVDMDVVLPWIITVVSFLLLLFAAAGGRHLWKARARIDRLHMQCNLDRHASRMNKTVHTGHPDRVFKWRLAFERRSKSKEASRSSKVHVVESDNSDKNKTPVKGDEGTFDFLGSGYNCIHITIPDLSVKFREQPLQDETPGQARVEFMTKPPIKHEKLTCERCDGISSYVTSIGLSNWSAKLCRVARLNLEPELLARELEREKRQAAWEEEQDERDAQRERGYTPGGNDQEMDASCPPMETMVTRRTSGACVLCGAPMKRPPTKSM